MGSTKEVSGGIARAADGSFTADGSKIVVSFKDMKSDQAGRDREVNRALETEQFPTATFVPTKASGLPAPLPDKGEFSFDLTGDLTLRNMTRSTIWRMTARADGADVAVNGATQIVLADFGIKKLTSTGALSTDEPRLEIDLKLHRDS